MTERHPDFPDDATVHLAAAKGYVEALRAEIDQLTRILTGEPPPEPGSPTADDYLRPPKG